MNILVRFCLINVCIVLFFIRVDSVKVDIRSLLFNKGLIEFGKVGNGWLIIYIIYWLILIFIFVGILFLKYMIV